MRDFFGMLSSARRFLQIGVGVFAVALFTNVGRADAVYTIDLGNSVISGFPSPYISVDVSLTDSTDAKVTFTSLSNPTYTYLMGGTDAADVNVNATTFTAGNFTLANPYPGYSTASVTSTGSDNVSSFGTFNLAIKTFDGWTHTDATISFTLTNTSGSWSSAANVLTANGSGYTVAAHVYVAANPPDGSNGAVNTGYGANSNGPNNVPAPLPAPVYAGLVLLGTMGLMVKLGRRSSAC